MRVLGQRPFRHDCEPRRDCRAKATSPSAKLYQRAMVRTQTIAYGTRPAAPESSSASPTNILGKPMTTAPLRSD